MPCFQSFHLAYVKDLCLDIFIYLFFVIASFGKALSQCFDIACGDNAEVGVRDKVGEMGIDHDTLVSCCTYLFLDES